MDPEVPIIAFFTFATFALPFIFFGFMRFLRYRETIRLAEHGLIRPSDLNRERHDRSDSLRWGVVITALGLALSCGLLTLGIGPWMLAGLLPTAFGISLLILHRLAGYEGSAYEDDEIPDDLPSIGTGPYGVGIPRVYEDSELDPYDAPPSVDA
jgi:hypothetical protein